MASYSGNENIMVSGQIAYFRKTGSMTNHGTLDLPNALSARSYAEGYVGPNSILHGTDLAETSDYSQCATDMETYLDDDWVEVVGERTVYSNANNIKTLLTPVEAKMQELGNAIKQEFLGKFTRLEYIQGTGTQYINLGIKPTSTAIAEVSFCNPSVNSWEQVFGTSTDKEFGFRQYSTTTNRYRFAVNGGEANVDVNASSTFVKAKLTGTGAYYINDVQKGTISRTAPGSNNLMLFKGNNEVGVLKIQYFKLWKSNDLVRDLVPVKRKSDNTVGMLDLANAVFYTNAGSGTFTGGPEIVS